MSGLFWLQTEEYPLPTPGAADIEVALSGARGPVAIRYRFQQRDHAYRFEADLTDAVYAASIDLDNSRPIVRTARFTINANAMPADFDPVTDHVAVLAGLLVPIYVPGGNPPGYYIIPPPTPGWVSVATLIPMGLFDLDAPTRTYSENGREFWEIGASDLTAHTLTAKTPTPYTVAAGTDYITAVETIFDLLGLRHDFPAVGEVTPVGFTWAPGTPYGQMVNDLLAGINYYPAWPTEIGVFTSRERITPSSEVAEASYSTEAEPRMLAAPFQRLQDTSRYSNRVIVVIDDPRRAAAYVAKVNADPTSPISTVSLGVMNTMPEISGGRVLDITVAEEIADFELRDQAARSQKGTIHTFPDPRRGAHESYALTIEDVEDATLWRVASWALSLVTGAEMTHVLGRASVVDVSIVVVLSGTILVATAANIVAGGRTLILTLPSGYQYVAAGATFDAERQGIIDGLVSSGTEAAGWNAEVVPAMVVGNVVRTSATIVTITLPAVAAYAITVPEVVTVSIPTTAIDGLWPSVVEPTATIIP